ncbi:hypothetical protein LBMAG53_32240 [Planctomycetota bacterium]|nr:hypothetical protein LBMAG53_32240 [Planctomycetota bacterium]
MAEVRPCRVALLERLSAGDRGPTLAEDRAAVLRSVLRNLSRVLNSRQGSAPAQMELGLPSPHELLQGFPANLPRTLKDIRACLQRYEPRLAGVVVKHVPSEGGDLAIRFQITAVLAGGDRTPVNLATAFTGDGRVRING